MDKWPFELRMGSSGFFCPGIYCGIGIAYGRELSMVGVPGLGQIISSVSLGLAGFDSMMGGIGNRVRRRVRSSGMKGVDAGLMCGFGVGYGFGAGLVLKPSALQAVQRGVQELNGRLAVAAQSRLPTQLNHLVKQPALESLPSVRQQGPGMGAQAVTSPALRLGDFSVGDEGAVSMHTIHRSHPSGRRHQVKQDGKSASDHFHLRDSSGSVTGEPRVIEERPGQQLHVKVEQPDLQHFTAALRELTTGLNDCTSSLKEATLELKQACADLRQSSKGA